MSNSPIELLADFFDIPEAYAKVYYQLLKTGSGTIGQVILPGKDLDINRQQIYNILDKLVAMDFVAIISQSKRGNIYMANTPETIAKNFLHKLEINLTKKKEKKEQFIKEINIFLTIDESPSVIDTFQGQIIPKDLMAETFTDLIDQTIRTFKIAVKDFSMGLMNHLQPTIKKALDRDTTVIHLLFEKTVQTEKLGSRIMDGSLFPPGEVKELLQTGRLKISFTNHLNQNFFLFDDVIFLLVFASIEEIDFSFVTQVDAITQRFKNKYDKLFLEGEKFNPIPL
jgi:sugar-specific transcriptional regulator TrmB